MLALNWSITTAGTKRRKSSNHSSSIPTPSSTLSSSFSFCFNFRVRVSSRSNKRDSRFACYTHIFYKNLFQYQVNGGHEENIDAVNDMAVDSQILLLPSSRLVSSLLQSTLGHRSICMPHLRTSSSSFIYCSCLLLLL